jgi:4-azaleucine resistance transporter AzlC
VAREIEMTGASHTNHKSEIMRGLRDALPIMLAYFPVGATFGVVAVSRGLPAWIAVLTSLVIYAGAAQFILASLYATGIAPIPFALTLLLVNLRHVLYGATVGPAFTKWRERQKWVAAFGLTDEVFAVAGSRILREPPTPPYHYALAFASYASWVGGTVAGAAVGSIVPGPVATVLAFGLPALFLALLLSQAFGLPQLVAALMGALAAVVATLLGASGIGIVAGALLGATAGVLVARVMGEPVTRISEQSDE